jgi:4a-hydroxytetrahydrobiopterin dehydratase
MEIPRTWLLEPSGAAITRECRFADFGEAFAFMTEMALFSARVDHHPEWSNVYNRVTLRLTTHDEGGLSERDIRWAIEADRVLARYSSPDGLNPAHGGTHGER